MANLDITFVHPTTGGTLDVEIDDQTTTEEIIDLLIDNEVMPNSDGGYQLAIKGGQQLQPNQTLASAGVAPNTTLRIIPSTVAGQL